MATLTYWCCECLNDSQAYNIRTKTKKEALQLREINGTESYGLPIKQTVKYSNALDLLNFCMGEYKANENASAGVPERYYYNG